VKSTAVREILVAARAPGVVDELVPTASNERFLRNYFSLRPARSALCCLFMTTTGEVWATLMAKRPDDAVKTTAFPVIRKDAAMSFLTTLQEHVIALTTRHMPHMPALDALLAACGGPIIQQLLQTPYPDRLVFVPHRLLHAIPWHACFIPRVDGSRLRVVDVVGEVSYASSLFELLYADWWPVGSSRPAADRALSVIDADAADLRWTRLELRYRRALQSLGIPIDIVTQASLLPESLDGYSRLFWSGHASSSPANWGDSHLRLQDTTIDAETVLRAWRLAPGAVVTLAGCETALDVSAGLDSDEYCGLDLAIRVAGAMATVSTMWAVDDAVAALGSLLVDLYRTEDDVTASAALAEFQSNLRTGRWHAHLPSDEQLGQYAERGACADEIVGIVDELRRLDPRELTGVEHWACWRCVSA
jgi:hypothetical protein